MSRSIKSLKEINSITDAIKYQEELYNETSSRYEKIFGRVLSSLSPVAGNTDKFNGTEEISNRETENTLPEEIMVGIQTGKMKRERLLAMVEEAERRRNEKADIEAQRVRFLFRTIDVIIYSYC